MSDIKVENFSFRYVRSKEDILHDLNFTIKQGEKVLLLGSSGVGKSTLLHLLAGVISEEEGKRSGSLEVPSQPGMVLQDPDAQIVMHTIGDDVAFTCENYCVPEEKLWKGVRAALDSVGIDYPLDHDSYQLSGGQKQRLALANMLAVNPDILLLDEPTANLDSQGAVHLKEVVLDAAQQQQQTLVIVEHNVELWADAVDRVIVLNNSGGIECDGTPHEVFSNTELMQNLNIWYPGLELVFERYRAKTGATVLETQDLTVGYEQPVLTGISQSFKAGHCYALLGRNGSGKTTLAMTLAGLQKKLAGSIVPGFEAMKSSELAQHLSVVFQNPEHQFIYETVKEEVKDADEHLLQDLSLTHLKDSNPFTLSGGQKRRLSVATALSHNTEIILLDEPTFGQDPHHWGVLCKLLQEELERGACLIISTHDNFLLEALDAQKIEVQQWTA